LDQQQRNLQMQDEAEDEPAQAPGAKKSNDDAE
jgi:hypothetical protein